MANPMDLEALRMILQDKRTHLCVGKVKSLDLATDRSALFALCSVLTQGRDVAAQVTWDATGPSAGSFDFPQVDDLVLLAFAEGDAQQCYLIKRLTSSADKIPSQAAAGHMVHKAKSGKKLYLMSGDVIHIGNSGTEDEPLVLGNVMKDALEAKYNAWLNATQIGWDAFGLPVFLDPSIRLAFTEQKQLYVTDADTNIVSQIAFTERGD